MGRTTPPGRILVENELDRLRRIAAKLRDPQDKANLLEILEYTYKVLDAYRYEPMSDPLEPIIIAGLLRCRRENSQAK